MRTSTNLKFQIPELDDQANVEVLGAAFDALDNGIGSALSMNGDASSAQVSFTRATDRENIVSGETFATLVGKISRWFADIKDAAFAQIANNDTTLNSGYVADARIVKTHGDEIDKHTTQLGGLYFTVENGKGYYQTSVSGTKYPFRNPTGTATAAQVLSGATFANASNDSLTGTMPNNGAINQTLTPSGDNSVSYTIPAGYTSGGTITANGSTAYKAGASSLYDNDTIYGATVLQVPHNTTGYSYAKAVITIPNGFTKLTIDESNANLGYKLSTELSALTTGTSVDGSLSKNQTVDVSGYKYVALQMAAGAWAADHDKMDVSRWHLSK